MLNPIHANRLLPAVIAILVALGVFVPARYQTWARHFGWLATTIVAPISHPFSAFSRWVSPADATVNQSEAMRELARGKEEAESEVLRLRLEVRRLATALEEMKIFSAVNSAPVRQVFAPVFASSSDPAGSVLRVRAGVREGVEKFTVATTAGLQLLGRVVSVDDRTCDVLPITAKASGPLQCMVMIDQTINGLVCTLTPTADGTLQGPLEDRRDVSGTPIEPKVGQLVRLSDQRWPESAQMLIVGKVTSIEAAPQGPLRKVVVVSPSVERLDRVSEVVLRTSVRSDQRGGGS